LECPEQGKLSALVQEEDRQEEERKITSIKLINAIQEKVEGQPGGTYAETICKHKFRA